MRHIIVMLLSVLLALSVSAKRNTTEQRQPNTVVTLQESDTLTAIILGSGSPEYNPDRSGPSVLIRYKDVNILVDMGNGTIAQLAEIGISLDTVDALFFTHHHYDHNEEFLPIFIKKCVRKKEFCIVGPEKTKNMVTTIAALYQDDIAYRMQRSSKESSAYEVKEITDRETFEYKGITITTTQVNHSIATIAYRFEVGGHSVVISGDTAYSQNLSALARNADILIIDSGSLRSSLSDSSRKPRQTSSAHASLDELCQMIGEANAKHTVLTHFGTRQINQENIRDQICKKYSGTVSFAIDGMQLHSETSR